jgi:MFS family permease
MEQTHALARSDPLVLGMRANLPQFVLLVVVNAFVGAMVGIERSVVPLLGAQTFGLASATAILSFIASFGLVKAFANLVAGRLSDRIGRKRVLVAGWLLGIPAPLLILWAPSWAWVVVANLFLGANQGLCWSTTVNMKIDLVGPRQRGLAIGFNEAAGYGAVALAAAGAGYLAARTALRPQPFVLGLGIALVGLVVSLIAVRESQGHMRQEAANHQATASAAPAFGTLVRWASWQQPTLFAASQAGLVNNLNDGLAWGLLPIYFASQGVPVWQIGILAASYPGVWALAQIGTGALSDRMGRKPLVVGGLGMQALALLGMALGHGLAWWLTMLVCLGLGTAAVYPTLLAGVSDAVQPTWRASTLGIYRFWRDSGYVIGALLAGVLADRFGISWAIVGVGILTGISGAIVQMRWGRAARETTWSPRLLV